MISYRTCVVSRCIDEKKKLIKITYNHHRWVLDSNQIIDGRSIYLSYNKEVISKFLKMKKRFKIDHEDFEIIKTKLGELIEEKNL